jgi:hypothetical protein
VYEGGDDSSPEDIAATAAALGTRANILPGLDHDTAVVEAGRVWEVVRPFLQEASADGRSASSRDVSER